LNHVMPELEDEITPALELVATAYFVTIVMADEDLMLVTV
jgi:hypothetical protein